MKHQRIFTDSKTYKFLESFCVELHRITHCPGVQRLFYLCNITTCDSILNFMDHIGHKKHVTVLLFVNNILRKSLNRRHVLKHLRRKAKRHLCPFTTMSSQFRFSLHLCVKNTTFVQIRFCRKAVKYAASFIIRSQDNSYIWTRLQTTAK